MTSSSHFETIIVGGSAAGLAAALSLGRSLRKTLVIDSGKPCNATAPQAHNFATQDGVPPAEIRARIRTQLQRYETVQFLDGKVILAKRREDDGFELTLENGQRYTAPKLILATGLRDLLPAIPGFADCWGISVLHCPYCHGYEVANRPLGVLANGEEGFMFTRLISQWTQDLTLFTNGPCTLSEVQLQQLGSHKIRIDERPIRALKHTSGQLDHIVPESGDELPLSGLFAKVPFEQHSDLVAQLGCALTETGHIAIDAFYHTSVPGVFAAGDNATPFRSIAAAVAAGTGAGALANSELIADQF